VCIAAKGPDYEQRVARFSELEQLSLPRQPQQRFKSQFEGVPKSPPVSASMVARNADGYHVFYSDALMQPINSLAEGSSFGEVALMSKEPSLRNATILCRSDCCFAVLDKANFQRIIGEHAQREISHKVGILKQVPIFASLPDRALKTLLYFLVPRKLRFREVIARQGEPLRDILILKSGHARVVPVEQMVREVALERPSLQVAFLRESIRRREKRQVDLAILGPMEVVGEEYLLGDRPLEYSAVCDSEECEV